MDTPASGQAALSDATWMLRRSWNGGNCCVPASSAHIFLRPAEAPGSVGALLTKSECIFSSALLGSGLARGRHRLGIGTQVWGGRGLGGSHWDGVTLLWPLVGIPCPHFLCRQLVAPFPQIHYFRTCSACAEKAMAPHSSTPAWKIPWTEDAGRGRAGIEGGS